LFSGNTNDASGTAEEGAGGFSLNNFGFGGHAKINLQACIFENNSSQDGAGAINLNKAFNSASDTVNIENCLLNGNSGGNFGGGIGLNVGIALTLTNNTIADNSNGGIVLADGSLVMQNNILDNPNEDDLIITSNDTMVTSLGGNLIGDSTMDAFLNNTDQSATNPLFEADTYQLSQNSSAIDAGVLPDNSPLADLVGAERIQGSCIDIGALESPYDADVTNCSVVTNTGEVLAAPSTLSVFPNPTSGLTHFVINNEWAGKLEFRIVNALGQVMHTAEFEKYDQEVVVEFDTSDLPKGLYQILVSDRQLMAVGSFMRL
jgi:hypothetical protein